MGNSQGAQFPYDVGEEVATFEGPVWRMHEGTRRDTGEPVTVFRLDKKESRPGQVALAQNFHRCLKTIRHPHILRYIDGVELESSIHVVTEPVRPFERPPCATAADRDAISLGLYQVVNAISFLNTDHKKVHGNVCPSSLFLTRAGEWRLGGFHVLFSHGDASVPPIFRDNSEILPKQYRSPEVAERKWSALPRLPVWTVDAWSLGCLIFDMYHGGLKSPEQLTQCPRIPKTLMPVYKRLLSSRSRLNPKKVLKNRTFDNLLVRTMLFLDNLALKSDAEKIEFFRTFSAQSAALPAGMARYRVLPTLLEALEFGSGMGVSFAPILAAVVRIGAKLDREDYSKLIVPAIVKLFSRSERLVRVHLLKHLAEYAEHMPASVVSQKVLPHVLTGFTDANALLRELTVKSMIYLVPKVSSTDVNSVVTNLAKLQGDPVPGIRTNAIYCLAKISANVPEGSRRKALFRFFSRGVKDPFAPARVAALASFQACVSQFTAADIARRVVPAVAVLGVDAHPDVRRACLQALSVMLKFLQHNADRMTANAQRQEKAAAERGSSPAAPGSSRAARTASVGGAVLSKLGSWAGAGLSAVASYASGKEEGGAAAAFNTPSKVSSTPTALSSSKPSRSASTPLRNGGVADGMQTRQDSGNTDQGAGGWDQMDMFADDGESNGDTGSDPVVALNIGRSSKKKKQRERRAGRRKIAPAPVPEEDTTEDTVDPWAEMGQADDSEGGSGDAGDADKGDGLDLSMLSLGGAKKERVSGAQGGAGGWGGGLGDLGMLDESESKGGGDAKGVGAPKGQSVDVLDAFLSGGGSDAGVGENSAKKSVTSATGGPEATNVGGWGGGGGDDGWGGDDLGALMASMET